MPPCLSSVSVSWLRCIPAIMLLVTTCAGPVAAASSDGDGSGAGDGNSGSGDGSRGPEGGTGNGPHASGDSGNEHAGAVNSFVGVACARMVMGCFLTYARSAGDTRC